MNRWLSSGGIIGPVQFVVTYTILGRLRSGYSPRDQAISDLGIGENAAVLNVSLVVLGLFLVGFAFAFHRMVRPEATGRLRVATMLLLVVVGVGYAAAGIFSEASPLHWILGAIPIFVAAPLAFLLVGLHLNRGGRTLRAWAVYSLLAGVATVILIGLTFYVFSSYEWEDRPAPIGRFGGLMERLLFLEIFAWYIAFGSRLLRVRDSHR